MRTSRFKMRHMLFASVAALAAVSACAVDLAREMQFEIPSQSLGAALLRFSSQAGVQVLTAGEEVSQTTSPGVSGRYSIESGLKQILAGTGFEFRIAGENTVSIVRKGGDDKSASLTPTLPIVIAQAESVAVESTSAPSETKANAAEPAAVLEEVVVTGTHIRGPVNPTVPITVYDRSDIERSGYGTTEEFIQSIPQNFKGGAEGASADGVLNSSNGPINLESASGVNLRGLGNSSTLVLLNGHRIAPSALGAAVDVSNIPLAAIERIEVLTDGASSIYGADAVGGVVNFILRKGYDGAETSVRYGTSRGDRADTQADQALGRSWQGGNGLIALHYEDAAALPVRERPYGSSMLSPTDLYPELERLAVFLSAEQQIASRLTLSSDVLYSDTDSVRNMTRTFQQDKQSVDSGILTANAGMEWALTDAWRIRAAALYSDLDTKQRSHFLLGAPPGYINDTLAARQHFVLSESSLIADGALFALPAGAAKVGLGVSYRDEDFQTVVPYADSVRNRNRSVSAAFGEILIPLIAGSNSRRGIRDLTLSASARYDDYSDAGTTTNPRVGLAWAPTEDLRLRASYGTAFRAPNVSEQLINAANSAIFTFDFASPGGGTEPVLIVAGSPQLLPEESDNTTFGLEYAPKAVAGLRLSLNYFDIVYKNRMISPPFDTETLLKPEVYGSLIAPLGSDIEVQDTIDRYVEQGFPFFVLTDGIGGIRHLLFNGGGLINASRVDTNGLDVGIDYMFSIRENSVAISLLSTFINEITTAFCDGCSATDLVDTYGEPLRARTRGMVTWTRGGWQLSGALNHVNSYTDTTAVPDGRVGAWTTADLNVRYSPERVSGLTLSLSAINLFDRDPPLVAGITGTGGFIASGFPYDAANANPLGRSIALSLSKSWGRP